MKTITLIAPKKNNDGEDMTTQIVKLENYIIDEFGGLTSQDVRGAWKDNGVIYYDDSVKYTIATEKFNTKQAWEMLSMIFIEFEQLAVCYGVGSEVFFASSLPIDFDDENWVKEFNK